MAYIYTRDGAVIADDPPPPPPAMQEGENRPCTSLHLASATLLQGRAYLPESWLWIPAILIGSQAIHILRNVPVVLMRIVAANILALPSGVIFNFFNKIPPTKFPMAAATALDVAGYRKHQVNHMGWNPQYSQQWGKKNRDRVLYLIN